MRPRRFERTARTAWSHSSSVDGTSWPALTVSLPSIAVAVAVMVLVVWGLLWAWHYIRRYRLAIGFASLTVGFGIIRFISLHEVDAWNAGAPWARTVVDLVAAAGVSAVAIARLRQLSDFTGPRHRT